MAPIVTTQYRYKRPPKKRNPVTIKVPEAITVRDHDDRKARIVITRPKRGRFGEAPDLTPEEHQQRGAAAEELFRELVRRATS